MRFTDEFRRCIILFLTPGLLLLTTGFVAASPLPSEQAAPPNPPGLQTS